MRILTKSFKSLFYKCSSINAASARLVERDPSKVDVAGSRPVCRSEIRLEKLHFLFQTLVSFWSVSQLEVNYTVNVAYVGSKPT